MKKISLYAMMGLFCILSSCNDFLTEYSQDQAYVQSYTDLDELLAGAGYMECMGSENFSWLSPGDCYFPYVHYMADETEVTTTGNYGYDDTPQTFFGYYTWQRNVSNNWEGTTVYEDNADWNKLYTHINVTNMVLSLIDEQPVATDNDRKNVQRIKGEAYFLRGAYYFILANLYGQPYSLETASTDLAVPIKLTNYIEDKVYTRATVKDTYEQVLEDLLLAEEYLRDIPRKSLVRAGHTATCLLLSRVYLYMQNYEEAVKWAKACLEEQSVLTNLTTFNGDEFLNQESSELIFTMGGNIVSAILSSPDGAGSFVVSEDLFKCYKTGDLRVPYFVNKNDEGYNYLTKVKYVYEKREVSDNFVLRTAEAYLNLAEAAACLGGEYITESLNAYNTLRQNRIANYQVESGLTGKELVDSIRLERRRELCFEGHRWFDLRRYMVNDLYPDEKTLTNVFVVYEYDASIGPYGGYAIDLFRSYTLPPHDAAWTLPIPQKELDANLGMPNNSREEREYVSIIE